MSIIDDQPAVAAYGRMGTREGGELRDRRGAVRVRIGRRRAPSWNSSAESARRGNMRLVIPADTELGRRSRKRLLDAAASCRTPAARSQHDPRSAARVVEQLGTGPHGIRDPNTGNPGPGAGERSFRNQKLRVHVLSPVAVPHPSIAAARALGAGWLSVGHAMAATEYTGSWAFGRPILGHN